MIMCFLKSPAWLNDISHSEQVWAFTVDEHVLFHTCSKTKCLVALNTRVRLFFAARHHVPFRISWLIKWHLTIWTNVQFSPFCEEAWLAILLRLGFGTLKTTAFDQQVNPHLWEYLVANVRNCSILILNIFSNRLLEQIQSHNSCIWVVFSNVSIHMCSLTATWTDAKSLYLHVCDFPNCEITHVLSNHPFEQMQSHNSCRYAKFLHYDFQTLFRPQKLTEIADWV